MVTKKCFVIIMNLNFKKVVSLLQYYRMNHPSGMSLEENTSTCSTIFITLHRK